MTLRYRRDVCRVICERSYEKEGDRCRASRRCPPVSAAVFLEQKAPALSRETRPPAAPTSRWQSGHDRLRSSRRSTPRAPAWRQVDPTHVLIYSQRQTAHCSPK